MFCTNCFNCLFWGTTRALSLVPTFQIELFHGCWEGTALFTVSRIPASPPPYIAGHHFSAPLPPILQSFRSSGSCCRAWSMDVEGSIKFPLVPGVIRFDADQMGLPRWAGTPRQASSFIALSDVPSFFLSPSSFIYTFFLPSDLTAVLHSSVCSTHCILSSFFFRGDKIPFLVSSACLFSEVVLTGVRGVVLDDSSLNRNCPFLWMPKSGNTNWQPAFRHRVGAPAIFSLVSRTIRHSAQIAPLPCQSRAQSHKTLTRLPCPQGYLT